MANPVLKKEELLKFIRKYPNSSINTILDQFASSSPWAVLALLAVLQDDALIRCLTLEGETCFVVEKRTVASYLDSVNQVFERSVIGLASLGLKSVKFVSGLSYHEMKKKRTREQELEHLLVIEACSYQRSLFEVELLLLRGCSLSDIAQKTGYSESWLILFAKQCHLKPTQTAQDHALMTEVEVQEKLEALLSPSPA